MEMGLMESRMINNVDKIGIVFENIDWILIPINYFNEFRIYDISKVIVEEENQMIANRLMFSLKANANIDASLFEQDIYSIECGEGTLFERMEMQDIT